MLYFKRGQSAIVTLLVDHGADVNEEDSFQQTPLHFAAAVG